MKYRISYPRPATGFIDIELEISDINFDNVQLQLPSWRPGRYELADFAKNIRSWEAFDRKGKKLSSEKLTKDLWEVDTSTTDTVIVKYNYFTDSIDAGNCFSSDEQLYVNPIHCCLYDPNKMDETCEVEIDIPNNWKIATALKKHRGNKYSATNFHRFVDSPFICSAGLQHNSYKVGKREFHIWFQGECKPEWPKIIRDFKKFTVHQLRAMRSFPVDKFHFFVQVTPYAKYHGVEHLNSTVLALGPGYDLMGDMYKDLLGVSSHELFHVWNIKSIRPSEMFPYDYAKENYSKLGYVAEGVTTYYGDMFLLRSGVFDSDQYFAEIGKRLNMHFANDGRKNLSVADSSFDTWLDGYVPGVPGRKTSIYTEGALCALMLDILLLRETGLKKSLIDVMQVLYNDFAAFKKGYTENDYMRIANDIAGTSLRNYFRHYVYGTTDYEPQLRRLLKLVACDLYKKPSAKTLERWYGVRLVPGTNKVSSAAIGSPADDVAVRRGDKILSINSYPVDNNAEKWSAYFGNDRKIEVELEFLQEKRTVSLKAGSKNFFDVYGVRKLANANAAQKRFYKAWTHQNF